MYSRFVATYERDVAEPHCRCYQCGGERGELHNVAGRGRVALCFGRMAPLLTMAVPGALRPRTPQLRAGPCFGALTSFGPDGWL